MLSGHDAKGYLMSRLRLKGRLRNKKELQRLLDIYPSLQPLSYGSSLRYIINEPDMNARFYIAEFSGTEMAIEIYSASSPLVFLKEGVVRLLSLASFVDPLYEFDIRSAFPYLIEVLMRQKTEHYGALANEKEVYGHDIILSKRIMSLQKENTMLRESEYAAQRALIQVAAVLLKTRYRGRCRISNVAGETGLGEKAVREAIMYACSSGCKVIWHGKEEFSLVNT